MWGLQVGWGRAILCCSRQIFCYGFSCRRVCRSPTSRLLLVTALTKLEKETAWLRPAQLSLGKSRRGGRLGWPGEMPQQGGDCHLNKKSMHRALGGALYDLQERTIKGKHVFLLLPFIVSSEVGCLLWKLMSFWTTQSLKCHPTLSCLSVP